MAINVLAGQATSRFGAIVRRQQNRLPPSVPAPSRPRIVAPPQSLIDQNVRDDALAPPKQPPHDDSPAERRWLGAPRSIRLPHMSLPRVTLPQVGMPHWSIKMPTLPVGELGELYEGASQLLALWNGPNIEDIRRFEGDATVPHGYGWFQSLLTRCALDNTDASREHFLAEFSAHGSPKLTSELAALEYFCMKTVYLRLQPGDRHRFCCDDFGWQTVTASIRDVETGLVAHILTPDEASTAMPASADVAMPIDSVAPVDSASPAESAAPAESVAAGKPPVLIVFRGTSRVSNQPEAELSERPTGCQADLDWEGIGFRAFAANQDMLLTFVRKYLQRGHRVILAGHSLGGVFAARTMCALTPQEQRLVQLRSFNASGLDPVTQQCAAAPENNIMVRHRDDKLPRAGGELLPGTLVITEPQNEAEALYPHGMPLLAANALNDHPAKFFSKPSEPSDMSRTLEMGRKFLCLVAHDRVDI